MSGDRKRKEPGGGAANGAKGSSTRASSSATSSTASSSSSSSNDSSPEPPAFASPSQPGAGSSQQASASAPGRRASLRSNSGDIAMTVTPASSSVSRASSTNGKRGRAAAAAASSAAQVDQEEEESTQTQSQPLLSSRPAAASSNGKRPRRGGGNGGGGGEGAEQEDEGEREEEGDSRKAGNRRDAMRRVAESRAAFFARADENDRAIPAPLQQHQAASAASAAANGKGKEGKARSVPSSTPLLPGGATAAAAGSSANGGAAASLPSEEKEEWNGPFSIARRMLKQRAAVKAAREERLEGGQVLAGGGGEGEEAERVKVQWSPLPREGGKKKRQNGSAAAAAAVLHQPPSLAEACLSLLLQHVDAIEALGGVSTQVRYQFAEALARDGRLTAEATMMLVEPGMAELYLPDCKHVSEAALVQALERAAEPPAPASPLSDDENDPPPLPPLNTTTTNNGHGKEQEKKKEEESSTVANLRVLRLRWCGQAFGPKAIAAFTRLGLGRGLEALELTGLYRLRDEDLIGMIAACPTLRALELPYKSHLSPRLLSACVDTAMQTNALTSLNLAYCADLPHDALAALSGLRNMRELDLRGLDRLTDGTLGEIVQHNGATLQTLRLRGCRGLSNEAIMHVGNGCRRLTALELGEMHLVSRDALQVLFSTPECARGLEEASLARSDVDDDVILALAMTSGNSLTKLDVNGGAALTDAALVALVNFCRNSLRELDLSFCRKVSDDALGHLADSCPRLRRLSLWGCTQVSDRFLRGHRRQSTLNVVGRAGSGSRVSLHRGLASASVTGGV